MRRQRAAVDDRRVGASPMEARVVRVRVGWLGYLDSDRCECDEGVSPGIRWLLCNRSYCDDFDGGTLLARCCGSIDHPGLLPLQVADRSPRDVYAGVRGNVEACFRTRGAMLSTCSRLCQGCFADFLVVVAAVRQAAASGRGD